jgi:hypothetical protein
MSHQVPVFYSLCKGFAGDAIVNAIGPLRQFARGENNAPRR